VRLPVYNGFLGAAVWVVNYQFNKKISHLTGKAQSVNMNLEQEIALALKSALHLAANLAKYYFGTR
jgi:hypothetical protein